MNRTLATVTAISTRRPLHALLACLPLVGGLGGCESAAPMRPPTPPEMERVEAREMSVVLFRISGTIDGKPATKLGPLIANDAFQVYLANLDRLEAPARVPAASLSGRFRLTIISVGDTLPTGYRFEALPDGIAVLPNGEGTVDLFVNHETSLVPFPLAANIATCTSYPPANPILTMRRSRG